MSEGIESREERRAASLLPSLLTIANLLCGYYAILSTMRGTIDDLDNAAKAIGLAILFDTLDGRVARMKNVASPFGRELDSLADVISFGVAPAFLMIAWGLQGLGPLPAESSQLARHIHQLGWIVSFSYLICGAWRLARFNIHSMNPRPHDPLAHRYFVGMPIPAAAGLIAATVHAFKVPIATWYTALVWLAIVALLAYLMVSPIRYYSFKEIRLRRKQQLIWLAIFAWSLWLYSEYVLLFLAATYVLSGMAAKLLSTVRRHAFPRAG